MHAAAQFHVGVASLRTIPELQPEATRNRVVCYAGRFATEISLQSPLLLSSSPCTMLHWNSDSWAVGL